MSNDPDQIRAEIERTREDLSTNVDALADKVNPATIAHRQVDKVRGAAGSVREAVMGTAASAGDASSSLSSSAAGAASQATTSVARKTRGNPLAAGLVAFGAGWLMSSLLPASSGEQAVAQALKDKAEPLTQGLTDAAKQVGQNLKEPAQEAATSVQASANEAIDTVKNEGAGAASAMRDSATEAADRVRNS